jgi:hypothetical protein
MLARRQLPFSEQSVEPSEGLLLLAASIRSIRFKLAASECSCDAEHTAESFRWIARRKKKRVCSFVSSSGVLSSCIVPRRSSSATAESIRVIVFLLSSSSLRSLIIHPPADRQAFRLVRHSRRIHSVVERATAFCRLFEW